MQSVKPLRLKRETYRLDRRADSPNVAHVWVDSGLSHLDGLYTYRIPNDLLTDVAVGSRLKVPFNSRSCEAIVVELSTSQESLGNLKVIESLLGKYPVANKTMIAFYAAMAKFWAGDPYSLIKSGHSRFSSGSHVFSDLLIYLNDIFIRKLNVFNYIKINFKLLRIIFPFQEIFNSTISCTFIHNLFNNISFTI